MRSRSAICWLIAGLVFTGSSTGGQKYGAEVWLTNPDKSALFERQKSGLTVLSAPANGNPTIDVDDKQKFQSIDGFGFALTGGSAQHLIRMEAGRRAAILKELFAAGEGSIGVSYLRLTIGASDLNERVFTYDDVPQTDPEMTHFDLGPDRADVIPVMKEILQLSPRIKILASPWSAPPWMKTNNQSKGGSLKPEYYDAYARYFVKYVRAMKAEGIAIDAITVQNEPLNPKNTPSMVMQAPEQAVFIKKHLGPAFRAAGIKTRIVLYDHNCDVPEYATAILADPEAARYVDGSGFHLYGGKIEAMSQVHDAYPQKNLYFTEQMVTGSVEARTAINIAAPVRRLMIGATRNWSRNVLLWNLAADSKNNPHTNDGGCGMCQGAITIDGNVVSRNLAYYVMAHASKFVRPGSVRIASTNLDSLPNVAFRTPDGKRVLLVVNAGQSPQTFIIRHGKAMAATLNAGAVATYIW
ncbi:MAG: glycoside hydrolase family 30 beta sandwich domain-containing protein [Candidatus Solibacter sp.]|jgi:glucosylceramidase